MYDKQDSQYDIDVLRHDMIEECSGAFFTGGFGGAAMEADKIRDASDEELFKMAERNGVHLNRYRKKY